ncbi:hypothetical protein BDQ17DRAFT_1431890 [Cyathus striatus]|nr:hypothetical protein BDQ17DRAFT_1431890 [Cyathus striatus]
MPRKHLVPQGMIHEQRQGEYLSGFISSTQIRRGYARRMKEGGWRVTTGRGVFELSKVALRGRDQGLETVSLTSTADTPMCMLERFGLRLWQGGREVGVRASEHRQGSRDIQLTPQSYSSASSLRSPQHHSLQRAINDSPSPSMKSTPFRSGRRRWWWKKGNRSVLMARGGVSDEALINDTSDPPPTGIPARSGTLYSKDSPLHLPSSIGNRLSIDVPFTRPITDEVFEYPHALEFWCCGYRSPYVYVED